MVCWVSARKWWLYLSHKFFWCRNALFAQNSSSWFWIFVLSWIFKICKFSVSQMVAFHMGKSVTVKPQAFQAQFCCFLSCTTCSMTTMTFTWYWSTAPTGTCSSTRAPRKDCLNSKVFFYTNSLVNDSMWPDKSILFAASFSLFQLGSTSGRLSKPCIICIITTACTEIFPCRMFFWRKKWTPCVFFPFALDADIAESHAHTEMQCVCFDFAFQKLADFGLSVKLGSPDDMLKTMCGTPSYMAP